MYNEDDDFDFGSEFDEDLTAEELFIEEQYDALADELDAKLTLITELLEDLRMEGYNIGIILHTYDPLTQTALADWKLIGDQYALSGVMQAIIK